MTQNGPVTQGLMLTSSFFAAEDGVTMCHAVFFQF